MAVKFGKVANSEHALDQSYTASIQMGIENAPTKLIVKYITDMYEDPLESSIRETISNAIDAMYAQGAKDANGLRVWLDKAGPGDVRTWLHVADDGCGMGYDKLVSTYTQYGVSDKRDDASMTGAFGLGAKSPLAFATEMQVITKTEEDGCLFVSAYRTQDDDFVADLPRKVDDLPSLEDALEAKRARWDGKKADADKGDGEPGSGAGTDGVADASANSEGSDDTTSAKAQEHGVLCYQTIEGFRIIPPNMPDGGYDESISKNKDNLGIVYRVADEIEGAHGTIVRFPLGVRVDPMSTKGAQDPGPVERAEGIIGAITNMLYAAGELERPIGHDPDVDARFFLVGKRNIKDDEGNEIPVKVSFARGLSYGGSATLNKVFVPLAHAKEKGETFELDDTEAAFKVGDWIYPATMTRWRDQPRVYHDAIYRDFPVIIEVPSSALAFLPSRDRLAETEDSKDTVAALLRVASEIICDLAEDPERMSELINWKAAHSYFGHDITHQLHDMFGYATCVSYDVVADEIAASGFRFSLPSIKLWEGRSAHELFDTARVCTGEMLWSGALDRFSVKTVMLAPVSFEGQLFGSGIMYDTASESYDAAFARKLARGEVDSWAKSYLSVGWAVAKSITCADNVAAIPPLASRDAAMPEDWEALVSALGSEELALRRHELDGGAYAIAWGAAPKEEPKKVEVCFGKHALCPIFPLGMAAPIMQSNTRKHTIVVDGSKHGIRKVRKSLADIAYNLGIDKLPEGSTMSMRYIIIPPKTTDAIQLGGYGDNWDDLEIDAIKADVEALYGERTHLHFVDSDMIDELSMPHKGSDQVKEEDDLTRMLKRNATYRLRKRYEMNHDENGHITEGDLAGFWFSYISDSEKPEIVLRHMLRNPGKVAVCVADGRRVSPDPYDSALRFAEAAVALDRMPQTIETLVCLSSNNFNERRAKALMEMGIVTLYDEVDKSKGCALIAAGEMTLEGDEEMFDYVRRKKKYAELRRKKSKGEIAYDPEAPKGPANTMGSQITSDDGRQWRDKKVIYTGWDCPQFALYKARKLESSRCATFSLQAFSELPCSDSLAKAGFEPSWIDKLTFGHESAKLPLEDGEVEEWRVETYSKIEVPDVYELTDAEEDMCKRLEVIYQIWSHKLNRNSLQIDVAQLNEKKLDALCDMGATMGVKEILDAWYEKRIPLADLLVGEGFDPDVIDEATKALRRLMEKSLA